MVETRRSDSRLRVLPSFPSGFRLLMAAVLALAMLAPAAEAAKPKTAAMVIDANTGKVLYEDDADEARYPASLTKMMTLYLTFELIEMGRLSYSSKIKMTEAGAAVPPSKLGLKPGETLTVLEAIKALVTKSANDVAVALGEHIGGTQTNFARLMTRKARQLGMTKTTFKNASGLPDAEQVTTARDILTLAMALHDHFPKHYKLFATRKFEFRGKVYRNHNALLGRYAGVDGIKTGYTNASGFNLVTSVRRGGRYVVAAVFGYSSSKSRNYKMRKLLDKTFTKASKAVTRRPVIARRPELVARRAPAPKPQPAVRPPPPQPVPLAKVRSLPFGAGLPRKDASGRPLGAPPSTLQAQAAALNDRQPPVTAEPATATAANGPFEIQIGAYAKSTDAMQRMTKTRERTGSLLAPYSARAVPVKKGASKFYRARFKGFADASAASSTCKHLKNLSIDCIVIRTE